MASNVSRLNYQFTVGSVDKTTHVDTFINITKRREQVLYRTVLGSDGVNVAYVGSDPISSSSNLSIADRSTSLAANRIREEEATTVYGTKTFTINTEDFVVTDVFTDESQTIAALPLFYQHVLKNARRDSGGDLESDVTLVSAEILDGYLQTIKVPEFKIDYTKGYIYQNILPDFQSSRDFTLYYVKYTIRDGDDIETYIELLDNETVFKPATYADLGPTLEIIVDGRKVYLTAEITGGYEVTLPIISTYAYKPTASSRIQILAPTTEDTEDPWYVRVANGKFFANIGGTLYKYYIAEYLAQVFTPEPPFKISARETCQILEENLIKTDHENIYEDDILGLFVEIEVNTKDDEAVAAFTTNPAMVDEIAVNGLPYVIWDSENRVGIRSIDHATGYIDIEGVELRSTYQVTGTYYYIETNYEFTLVDFNPISNKEALRTRTTLFIVPEAPLVTESQTLYYLKTDETGRVVESNWSDFDNETETYLGEELYYELKPSWKPAGPYHNFVEELSVEVSGVFLILGDMTVAGAQSASEVSTIDSRRRGGGIIDTEFEAQRQVQPELQWYWDEGYWDGIPYPGNASYLVEVPVNILEGAGGRFLSNEVKEIVKRHTAEGVYPVVRAYGVDITVSGIEPHGESITLRWGSHEY